MRSSSLPILL